LPSNGRKDFLAYVSAREQKAISLGGEKVEMEDLTANQFAISDEQHEFLDLVAINMGPSRRARGGGIWCDCWIAYFALKNGKKGTKVGTLENLSVFRDEFNTLA
jgi:hypothetical protein